MKLLGIEWKSEVGRGIAIAVIFAIAGVIVGFLVIPHSPRGVDPKAPVPQFTLLGQPIVFGTDAAEKALQLLRRHAAGSIIIKAPGGRKHEVPRALLGAEIEKVRLAKIISDASDAASPMRRKLAEDKPKGPVALPIPITLNPTRALETILQLKDLIDQASSDARLDLETRKLVPEQEGIELDIYATYARLQQAVRNGDAEVEAAVQRVTPRLQAKQLGNLTFDDVLGYFETNYARGEKSALRTFNLRLAASKLDGHVILPGETFDFNEVVGPRDEAHGYKVAPVIAEGELVDGIGGGTCQIAGTLHGASWFAGLKVLSRRPHTRPSGYIKMGLDSAVAYPSITLKLKNPFDFPVVLHETVKDGVVRAEILGPQRKLTVTFVRRILEVQPFEELERPDPKLPAGRKVLSQRGIPGFKILRYRIVRDGPFAVREKSTDTYPPTAQIIRVGTGDMPLDSVRAEDDQHPEYVADEYLTITQGPGLRAPGVDTDQPGGGTVENRIQGSTGARGWIEKAGYSHWHSDNDKDAKCSGDDCPDAASKAESKKGDSKKSDDKKGADKKGDKKSTSKGSGDSSKKPVPSDGSKKKGK
jgi:vancomycin resistance protein YoaR